MSKEENHIQLYNLSKDKELLLDTLGINENAQSTATSNKNNIQSKMELNTILYGPPGTGKTYHTVNHALEIIYGKYDTNGKPRTEIKKDFDELVKEGRIVFSTFHQSMSYEDFIEGIKPVMVEEADIDLYDDLTQPAIQYEIVPGVFKKLADTARVQPKVKDTGVGMSEEEFNKANFFKMSLGYVHDANDYEIYRYCLDNGYIALGWGDNYDYSGMSPAQIRKAANEYGLKDFEGRAINRFVTELKVGDYVVVPNGNTAFRAIGRISGDYEYNEKTPVRYPHFRKVDWLLKDVNIPVSQLQDRNFSMQSIYGLNKYALNRDFFVQASKDANTENYVLIIDEINRGNVSQIFGELITLIEEDKREGKEEALVVTLPYSKEKFSVPANLYIIGTMNTADRSVEALDSALRRRFTFISMEPKPDELKNQVISEINLAKLLSVINDRISYLLDNDHKIGHSYFMNIKDEMGLRKAFGNKIIPLLKEYFYNDYEKIYWILGSAFVKKISNDHKIFNVPEAQVDSEGRYIVEAISEEFDIISALNITINGEQ